MRAQSIFISILFSIGGAYAQDEVFAPEWVLNPSVYKENHFSASACVRINDNNEMTARFSALDIARTEIGYYIKGFDPANPTLSEQLVPKVYMSDSAVWLKDDGSRHYCVLASMNYLDLKNASSNQGEDTDLSEIHERFALLTQLSTKGQERERLQDEVRIAVLEKKRKRILDGNAMCENVQFSEITVNLSLPSFRPQHVNFKLSNDSGVDIGAMDVTVKFYSDKRTLPLAYAELVEIRPLGGLAKGEEISFSRTVTFPARIIDVAIEAKNSLDGAGFRWEMTPTHLYDFNGEVIARWKSMDYLQTRRFMGELIGLKAKWGMP